MKLLKLKLALISGLFIATASAQDVRYTQYFSSPLQLNPAIMGANQNLDITANYRSQWGSIGQGDYTTATVSMLYPVLIQETGKLDVGLSVINDQAGAFNTMNISLGLSYDLLLSETDHHLTVGLLGGYVQKSLDASGLTFDEQYVNGSFDASNTTGETIINEQTTYADAGFGLMWYYNPARSDEGGVNAFAGVSGYHVHNPDESFTESEGSLPSKYIYMAGVKLLTKGKFDFTPNIRLMSQSGSQEIATGLYADYNMDESKKFTAGAWYKQKDAVAFLFGLQISGVTFGYSYDLGMAPLNNSVAGPSAHEIMLSYKINWAEKKGMEYNPSPFPLF